MKARCTWCPRAASHEMDEQHYCCACFNLLVEKCGNIKIPLAAAPTNRLPPQLQERLHILAAKLTRSRRAGFRCDRQRKTEASR